MRRVIVRFGLAIASALMVLVVAAVRGETQARPSVELLETKPARTQTSLEIVGRVKNITARELSGVTVYCDFQDANGNSIKREQGRLVTDPLGPNQISEFKISTPDNAGIQRFNVTFAEIFGGPLATKDSRK